jgi:Uma2 family endonuclease
MTMSRPLVPVAPDPDPIEYPESDGQPMADNTQQFRWISVLAGNIAALFRDRADVFVCGDQFWYPVQGEPNIRAAPDVYAVFGRPKGDRPSYKQWEEGNIPMTVVFEVRSPKNTEAEMAAKFDFYDEHGVEEYYDYDPDTNHLLGYRRGAVTLVGVAGMHGYRSPRLGISFDLSGPELVVRYPDGRPFLTFEQIEDLREKTEQRAIQGEQRAEQERQRADQAEQVAVLEKQRAEQERQRAEEAKQRADQEKQRADQEKQRRRRLAELTRKSLQQQLTPEEMEELQQLMGNG